MQWIVFTHILLRMNEIKNGLLCGDETTNNQTKQYTKKTKKNRGERFMST